MAKVYSSSHKAFHGSYSKTLTFLPLALTSLSVSLGYLCWRMLQLLTIHRAISPVKDNETFSLAPAFSNMRKATVEWHINGVKLLISYDDVFRVVCSSQLSSQCDWSQVKEVFSSACGSISSSLPGISAKLFFCSRLDGRIKRQQQHKVMSGS